MSSTNKTTHYNLSQYVSSDKPTYLVDYNADMSAIDTGIYNAKTEAETNTTAIGTLSNLTTTEKSNLVGAINEIDSDLGNLSTTVGEHTTDIATNTSAIGTLASLDTTAKNNLVAAVNEVNTLISKLNLVNFETYGSSELALVGATYFSGNLKLASNSDYSVVKLYGNLQYTATAYLTNITISNVIPSGYRPSTDITINGLCTVISNAGTSGQANADVTFKTDGSVYFSIANGNNNLVTGLTVHPCLLFLKDFGDTPSNQ